MSRTEILAELSPYAYLVLAVSVFCLRLAPEDYLIGRARFSEEKLESVLRDMRAATEEEAHLALGLNGIDPAQAASRVVSSFVKLKRARLRSSTK